VLNRPYRTTMIAVRVISRMPVRQRANAPAAEHIVREQPIGDPPDEFLFDDAGCETMSFQP
jgi:hypothetical protein